jgi:allantoin racemase
MKLTVIHAVVRSDRKLEGYQAYLKKALCADTELDFERVEFGFPSIECDLHGMVNGAQIVRLVQKAEQDGADGVFVNCFDDPGVYAARELARIPVFGAYQPALLTAMGLAERVGIITTDRAGILSEERKARLNGFDGRVASIRAVDMGVLSLEGNLDLLVDRLAAACADMFETDRVGALTLGCTGMHAAIGPLRARLKAAGCPVAVIEPLQNGVSYLEHTVRMGYTNALGVIGDIDSWKDR